MSQEELNTTITILLQQQQLVTLQICGSTSGSYPCPLRQVNVGPAFMCLWRYLHRCTTDSWKLLVLYGFFRV